MKFKDAPFCLLPRGKFQTPEEIAVERDRILRGYYKK